MKKKKVRSISLGTHTNIPGLLYHPEALAKWMKGEYFPPLYVEISPTTLCNHNCSFCYVNYVREDKMSIPEDLLIKIFRDLGKAGVKACELQGTGEPLLNKGVPDAIVAGKEEGMDICLVTNGSLFTEDKLEKIIPCLSFCRFSSLECSPKLYARTHGAPEENYNKAITALKTAIKIRERDKLDTVIVATFTAFEYNISHIVETTQMVKDIGVDIFTIKPALRLLSNPGHENLDVGLHEKYADLLNEAKSLSDENFKFNIRDDMFVYSQDPSSVEIDFETCYGVEFEILIDADAKIYPCMCHWRDERYCFGDLSKNSFEEIWKSDERKERMQQFLIETKNPRCDVCCKQFSIHPLLNKLKNPPLHSNVI